MLGHLLVLALALSIIPFVSIQDVFANSFDVELDKDEYYFGDTVRVSGSIQEIGMPVIAMSIYDPEGMILTANNLEISSDGNFSKKISLSSPSYEKTGEYIIEFQYEKISDTTAFDIISKELDSDNSENHEQESNESENYPLGNVLVFTDKAIYTDNDTITIYGSVSEFNAPTVLLGVYDPFGMPTGFYFGNLDSKNEFSTSFLVKAGVNFRVDGTYVIKAHYGDLESNVSFDFWGEELTEDTTTEDTTTEDTTTEDTTTEDTTTEDTTTEDTTTEDTTTEDTTTEDTTTEDTTTEDTTTEDTTTEDTTTEDTTTEDTTTEDTTTEDTTTEDTTTEDTTTEDNYN